MTAEATHSLRTRLLGWLMAAIVLAALAQSAFAYFTALTQADIIFDRHLRTMATALTSGTALGSLPPSGEINADRAGEDFVVQLWKDRKSTRLNSSHRNTSRMPSSA